MGPGSYSLSRHTRPPLTPSGRSPTNTQGNAFVLEQWDKRYHIFLTDVKYFAFTNLGTELFLGLLQSFIDIQYHYPYSTFVLLPVYSLFLVEALPEHHWWWTGNQIHTAYWQWEQALGWERHISDPHGVQCRAHQLSSDIEEESHRNDIVYVLWTLSHVGYSDLWLPSVGYINTCMTFPMMTLFMSSGAMPPVARAALAACSARSVALWSFRTPP